MTNFKYKEVINFILDYIYNNSKKGIEKIPSERFMSQHLNTSRTTVKYAIDKLIEDRLLYKIHGKGTFINADIDYSKVSINKRNPDSLNLNISSKGLKLESQVISSKVLYNYSKLDYIFPTNIHDYYELIRKRIVKDGYYCVEISYFPFRIFPDANRHDFSVQSLYEYMENKGYKPVYFNKSIRVSYNRKISDILKTPLNIPLFLEEYEAFTKEGQLIEYTKAYTDSRFVEYEFYIN